MYEIMKKSKTVENAGVPNIISGVQQITIIMIMAVRCAH